MLKPFSFSVLRWWANGGLILSSVIQRRLLFFVIQRQIEKPFPLDFNSQLLNFIQILEIENRLARRDASTSVRKYS